MAKVNPLSENQRSRKTLLRVLLKIFTAITFLFLGYIFTVGLFSCEETTPAKSQYTFDLSALSNGDAAYFKPGNRELLVIKTNDKLIAFWANDPIYGCKLEFFNTFIKPVCIDIKYNLNGFSSRKNQQLTSPKFTVHKQNLLIIDG
ncbi:hypothetical protein MNBD_GAMMA07-889 [hydrothermal vent metagenome]|uniref:Uncharacterized protein n=1 Tax=hydrothermal vent metagenome TaxID=652676 RepID=A0A3B0XKR0_9ZZZZ